MHGSSVFISVSVVWMWSALFKNSWKKTINVQLIKHIIGIVCSNRQACKQLVSKCSVMINLCRLLRLQGYIFLSLFIDSQQKNQHLKAFLHVLS